MGKMDTDFCNKKKLLCGGDGDSREGQDKNRWENHSWLQQAANRNFCAASMGGLK